MKWLLEHQRRFGGSAFLTKVKCTEFFSHRIRERHKARKTYSTVKIKTEKKQARDTRRTGIKSRPQQRTDIYPKKKMWQTIGK